MVRTTTRNNKAPSGQLSAKARYRCGDLVDLGEDEDDWEAGFEARGEDGVEEEETHWRRGGGNVDVGFLD